MSEHYLHFRLDPSQFSRGFVTPELTSLGAVTICIDVTNFTFIWMKFAITRQPFRLNYMVGDTDVVKESAFRENDIIGRISGLN